MHQTIGPVILDLLGPDLSAEEREIVDHPSVGGVILFARNYESPKQLTQLCRQIHAIRNNLLIAVDQEGGRVQRFKEGFTRIPPMGELGKKYENSPQEALKMAEQYGQIMASELLTVGVDLSFAPVLDLNKELNPAIGDRSFHRQANIVITLAKSFITGMHQAGMAAVGKHFPGHGSVAVDSHHDMPVDKREYSAIAQEDLIPFQELIQFGIEGLMPAHIHFPAIDERPVGFSKRWLTEILRQQLRFSGIIFSDDLNMEGAAFAGDYPERAQSALEAGCDMVLICNNRSAAIKVLDQLPQHFFVSPNQFAKIKRKKNEFTR